MKEIAGYDGKYLVSEEGVVYSIRRQGSDGRIITQRPNTSGYMRVDLRKGKEKQSLLVHRIVAEAFIPNPENKKCVNHIDGNKNNNSFSNLEWCSHSENMKHAVAHNLNKHPELRGEKHPRSKLSQKDVKEIKALKNNNISGYDIAEKYNVSSTTIYNIWKEKVWT